ncbi:MAG TPA: hypothetical protein VII83_08475 [Gaiellaceae bacterium]|jgi:hypothetical protein
MPGNLPLWIDYADRLVPFWQLFARPGVIAAGSSPTVMPQLRAAGAATVYFDLNMKDRVGTPTDPLDLQTVVAESNDRFDRAVARTGCATPIIAENEFFAADSLAPWTAEQAARYEQNVLTMMQTLASRGAHPYLLVPRKIAVGSIAPSIWRRLAGYGTVVLEVYPSARKVYAQGAIAGSRQLRLALRRAISSLTSIGVKPARVGVMLGFQMSGGSGGRDGLEPASAWWRVVKWQAQAARQVARETLIDSIWSWGWGGGAASYDPDNETAACVYLWTRSSSLCDALTLAGPEFNSSLSEANLILPRGTRCRVGPRRLTDAQVAALAHVTKDQDKALSLLYARAVESVEAKVSRARVLATERAIIALRFAGSVSSYRRALAGAGASRTIASAIISDELRERTLSASLRVRTPSAADIQRYYRDHGGELVRLVRVRPTASWLGGRTKGYALGSHSPSVLYRFATGSENTLPTVVGRFRVSPIKATTTLGRLPLSVVRNAIRAALVESERSDAFAVWSLSEQKVGLGRTSCTGDRMPLVQVVDPSGRLPFLSLRDDYSGR